MLKFLRVTLFFVLISSVFAESAPPQYNERYSKIPYQPSENGKSHKAELNSVEKHREEVTESNTLAQARSPPKVNIKNPNNSPIPTFEVTTEPESEQINFARFVHRNIVKDKLVNNYNEDNLSDVTTEGYKEVTTSTTEFNEQDTTLYIKNVELGTNYLIGGIANNMETHQDNTEKDISDDTSTTELNNNNKTQIRDKNYLKETAESIEDLQDSITVENIETVTDGSTNHTSFLELNENSTTLGKDNTEPNKIDFIKENTETIENLQNTEIVEDIVTGDAENVESFNESELSDLNNQGAFYIYHPEMLLQKVVYRIPENNKYENLAPIVEHFYSYDPRTFILQRLIFRP